MNLLAQELNNTCRPRECMNFLFSYNKETHLSLEESNMIENLQKICRYIKIIYFYLFSSLQKRLKKLWCSECIIRDNKKMPFICISSRSTFKVTTKHSENESKYVYLLTNNVVIFTFFFTLLPDKLGKISIIV